MFAYSTTDMISWYWGRGREDLDEEENSRFLNTKRKKGSFSKEILLYFILLCKNLMACFPQARKIKSIRV